MADDGTVQLPPDSTGSLVRTRTLRTITDTSGTAATEHTQVAMLGNPDGTLSRTVDEVYDLLDAVLNELRRHSIALSILSSTDITS